MTIKASEVKLLREKTGLGMMECKKALEESNGNLEEAITNLRKNRVLTNFPLKSWFLANYVLGQEKVQKI